MDSLRDCRDAALKYLKSQSDDTLLPSQANNIALIAPYLRHPEAISLDRYVFYAEGKIGWIGRTLISEDLTLDELRAVKEILRIKDGIEKLYYGSDALNTPPASTDSILLFKPGDAVIWMQVK